MSLSRNLAGILAPIGRVRQCDLDAFSKARLNLIRLRAEVNAPDDISQWRDAGAVDFILHLLSPLTSQIHQTPQMFVDYFSADIQAFLECGVRYIEVHDKPNRSDRGAGVSWADGDGFASWFFETYRLLRLRFGDEVRIGFPAIFPTDLLRSASGTSLDEMTFSEQCADAMATADWVAIHTYWRTLEEMRGFNGALRFLRLYMEQLPKQMFIITEFANVNPHLPSETRGTQYGEFYTATAQYDRVVGACCLILRSNDRLYEPLAWLRPDGQPRPLLSRITERSQPPDPKRLWMLWPTEYCQYNQYFGANQQKYYDRYQMAGGHNGVDLRVDRITPNTSPIYAALAGTVIQVAMEETGYGHYVRIRSYGPEGQEITLIYAHLSASDVTVGMLVNKGDVLGWAGSTGECDNPHLHLGMRVKGVRNGAVHDWLNPRPYLTVRTHKERCVLTKSIIS